VPDTILEYLEKHGDDDFACLPFGEVDALILSQFSYLKFDHFFREKDPDDLHMTGLDRIISSPDFDSLFSDLRYEKNNRKLFELMSLGRRFSDLSLGGYMNIVDRKRDIQFSAVTFSFPSGPSFVAYRGTDENMVGWKEDFNLSILDRIPGEEEAVRYLEKVSGSLSGSFYVGGHSKGGLLAVYASSLVPDLIKERIINVYCFDSPAIREDIRVRTGYPLIRDRILKYVPQSSLIGMIFETDDIYHVIRSSALGVLQHDPYTWVVRDTAFEPRPALDKSAQIVNGSVSKWIGELDTEERSHFIDIIFKVADACDEDDLVSISLNPIRNLRQMLDGYEEMAEGEKQFLKQVINGLAKETEGNAVNEMHSGFSEFIESVDRWIEKEKSRRGITYGTHSRRDT